MLEQVQQEEPNHTALTPVYLNILSTRDDDDTASDSQDDVPLGISRYDSDSDDETNNGVPYYTTLYKSGGDDDSSQSSRSTMQVRSPKAN